MLEIREAHEADLPAILEIYNDVVATSTAIYRDEPATLDDRRFWFAARKAEAQPVLVAIEADAIVGFAAFGGFRPWPGYRFTVEHSVHVRADRRGRGVGAALMAPLIDRASALGMHVMIAGIDADNEGSIRFHERLGFEKVAHMKQVGFKFGRWLDLVLMQRFLTAGDVRSLP
jgi:phosphinothricin acetyltransferase